MAYEAKILADSISPAGHRLTTFLVTFPRIVLAEVNTHKMLSKNSASSRAIPVAKRIAAVEADPFVPESFGRNQKGMQPGAPLEEEEAARAYLTWNAAKLAGIKFAGELAEIGVHKQYANRLLEPFSWHTAIISGTDWSNFWHLRVHPAAQGEFSKAAAMMTGLYNESAPYRLNQGEWHLPLVSEFELDGDGTLPDAVEDYWLAWAKVSSARCGRVSTERHERKNFEEDVARADDFAKNGHLSPLEHAAKVMEPWELMAYEQLEVTVRFENGSTRQMRMTRTMVEYIQRYRRHEGEVIDIIGEPHPVHYCGNYNGWVQLRKLIPNEDDALAPRTP